MVILYTTSSRWARDATSKMVTYPLQDAPCRRLEAQHHVLPTPSNSEERAYDVCKQGASLLCTPGSRFLLLSAQRLPIASRPKVPRQRFVKGFTLPASALRGLGHGRTVLRLVPVGFEGWQLGPFAVPAHSRGHFDASMTARSTQT